VEEEWMRRFNRRIVIISSLIVLILILFEIYVHTYVQLHLLAVVSENEAVDSFPFGHSTGTYSFSSTGCRWLVIWKADEASASINYGFICIFKVEENKSLFTLYTELVVLELEPGSNNTGWFTAELHEVSYETNRTSARISYNFGQIGTYQVDFGLIVQVWEETLLATFLREETRIPLQTVIHYGP